MSTSYEETTTTRTSGGGDIGFDKAYITSLPGILKIVEIVITLIAFICALIPYWWVVVGGGWVQFVTIVACITAAILLVLNVMGFIHKLPGPWLLIQFIYYVGFVLLLLTAAILSAAQAARYAGGYNVAAIGACAFFCFAALAVYAVDAFFHFRDWRASGGAMTGGGTSTTTTTTTTHSSQAQY